MKRFFLILLVIIICIIVSYFIPVIDQSEIPINNTSENVASSFSHPKSWIKWETFVRDAWRRDSSACQFLEDTANHQSSIEIPGKKIIVTRVTYLSYHLEEKINNKTEDVTLAILPFIGNKETASMIIQKLFIRVNRICCIKFSGFGKVTCPE